MKRTFLCFLFLFVVQFGYAQDYKTDIETEFMNYLQTIIDRDFEKSMDYLTEDFFTLVPREQMIGAMEQIFNNPAVEFSLKDPKVIGVEDRQVIDNKQYALLTYSNVLFMKFVMEEAPESEEDAQLMSSYMKASLESTFGEGNVKYDAETEFFEIYSEKKVCAISSTEKDEWKFLVLENAQKPMLAKLLPKEIMEVF